MRIIATEAVQDRKPGGDYEWTFNNNDLTMRDLFALAVTAGLSAHYGLEGRKDGRADEIWAIADSILSKR